MVDNQLVSPIFQYSIIPFFQYFFSVASVVRVFFCQNNLTKNLQFGIRKRIWRNGFLFAHSALFRKEILPFFRLRETTGKRKPDAGCVGLPEEVCRPFQTLRGFAARTDWIEKKKDLLPGKEGRRSGITTGY